MRPSALLSLAALATALAGCDMAPHYAPPANPAPPQWPQGAAYPPAQPGQAGLPWRQVFTDARLQTVIDTALANNVDIAASLASVTEARAQYHVERSYQLPTINGSADATGTRSIDGHAANSQTFEAGAGASSFELDLFGRVKNQTRESLETYLSTESGYRSARLTLVANVATAWVTLAADRDLETIERQDVASAARSVQLEQSLFDAGLAAGSDVASAQATLEGLKSDLAAQVTSVAQDRNALERLAGGPLADDLLPAALGEIDAGLTVVPAGVSSDVLLRRPDVVEAEHTLKGSYAAIGAARAAFFPQITLTSSIGVASTALRSMFSSAALAATGTAAASMPLLGGTAPGNLEYARAQRDYALAEYKAAAQNAFKDVADALARRGTITDQRGAQDRYVAAAKRAWDLADVQYRAGTGAYINDLTAQRTFYAAQQTRVATVLADLTNRVTLYSAIGADDTLAGPVDAEAARLSKREQPSAK